MGDPRCAEPISPTLASEKHRHLVPGSPPAGHRLVSKGMTSVCLSRVTTWEESGHLGDPVKPQWFVAVIRSGIVLSEHKRYRSRLPDAAMRTHFKRSNRKVHLLSKHRDTWGGHECGQQPWDEDTGE